MADVWVLPDCEGAVRAWARGLGLPGVGNKVFFGRPKEEPPEQYVELFRVGGGLDEAVPLDNPTMQFNVWGPGRNKAAAATTMRALCGAIMSLKHRTPMGDEATGSGASVESVIWSPDPDTDRARYVVTARFTIQAA